MKKFLSVIMGVALLSCIGCSSGDALLTEGETSDIFEDEDNTEPADIVYYIDNLSQEQKNMLGPMDSAAYALNDFHPDYDWNNGEYVWDAISTLIVWHISF